MSATMGIVSLVPHMYVVILIHSLGNGKKFKAEKLGATRFAERAER